MLQQDTKMLLVDVAKTMEKLLQLDNVDRAFAMGLIRGLAIAEENTTEKK